MPRDQYEREFSHPDDVGHDVDLEARTFSDALLDLSVLNREDLVNVFATIAEVGARALNVERVSLWQYDRERSVMVCPAAWVRGVICEEPMVIARASHPSYWAALHLGRTLPVTDAASDDRLAEIRDSYVSTHGIRAMLDSSIRIEKASFGIVCMESLDGPREWTTLEEQFVASLADRTGLSILLDTQRRLEGQLRHAQKMEALGVMAGGIAHDFNNMLSIVLASTGAARMKAARQQDVSEDLDAIDLSVQRATALTRKLLYLSRQDPIERESFDLNDAVRDFASTARLLVPDAVRLHLLPSSQPLRITAERVFLDQALQNLTMNAVQAMPDGGSLTIATRLLQVDDPRRMLGMSVPAGHYAHLRVLDTGVGIPAPAIPRIFDPFYTTRGSAGNGLGLSVVYGGMRQHGGLLGVESVLGRGTVFHLLFPLAS